MAKEIEKKENAQAVAEAVSKTDLFFRENKKILSICAAAVLIIAACAVLYQKFVWKPKKAEALEQMYPAQNAFDKGEYETALNGDGNILGFAEVAKEYGKKAGKAVNLYAGVCELQLGNYEQAISWLKKYNGKDNILAARALACIGDAYIGLGETAKAVPFFTKAAAKSGNMFSATYLLKAGVANEELGKDAEALKCYKEIKDRYPMSMEGMEIDKYISRIENK